MSKRAPGATFALIVLVVTACTGAAPSSSAPTPSPTSQPSADASQAVPSTAASADASVAESAPPSAAANELDVNLASNFGSTTLAAGFTPDPHSVDVISGGPIDTSYLGGECRGFATRASDYDVTYQAGQAQLLRFYFVADEAVDTTLIINAPDGSWACNDDATLTIDPQVDFESPTSGRYDIWVGSFDSGAEAAGTLFVTELESNGP
jgi:hypothetical protein